MRIIKVADLTQIDLTNEELRAACEAAGLVSWPAPDGSLWWGISHHDEHALQEESPALIAYVASLLVARVRQTHGLDYSVDSGHPDLCLVEFTNQPTGSERAQTVHARGKADEWAALTIRAAMELLGHD